jgi:hypothetical protein
MSDDLSNNMYNSQTDDTPSQPTLISQKRVSLTNLGRMQQVEIEGQSFVVVDPRWIEELERRLQQSNQTISDLHNRMLRSNTSLEKLSQKFEQLSRRLDRITGEQG